MAGIQVAHVKGKGHHALLGFAEQAFCFTHPQIDIHDTRQGDGPGFDFPACFAVANPQTFPANIALEGFGRSCFRKRHEEKFIDAMQKGEG